MQQPFCNDTQAGQQSSNFAALFSLWTRCIENRLREFHTPNESQSNVSEAKISRERIVEFISQDHDLSEADIDQA